MEDPREDKIKEEKKALPLHMKMTVQLHQRLKNTTLINKALKKSLAVEQDASLADVATWMSAQNAGKSLRWSNDKGF